jgi:hypothetical protein
LKRDAYPYSTKFIRNYLLQRHPLFKNRGFSVFEEGNER